jgi:hypothetical protein
MTIPHVEALAREGHGWNVYVVQGDHRVLVASAFTIAQVQVALTHAAERLHWNQVTTHADDFRTALRVARARAGKRRSR